MPLEYTVLSAGHLETRSGLQDNALLRQVHEAMEAGWRPIGGIAVVQELSGRYSFYQALTRDDSDPWVAEAKAVSAAAEMVAAAAAPAQFDVIMYGYADKKIAVIKTLREQIIPGLGLKEAKDLVEMLPATVLQCVSEREATAAKTCLEQLGAQITLMQR